MFDSLNEELNALPSSPTSADDAKLASLVRQADILERRISASEHRTERACSELNGNFNSLCEHLLESKENQSRVDIDDEWSFSNYAYKLRRLDVKVPRILAKSLGYHGSSRWVQFFWEPEPVGKTVCADATDSYFGSKIAWELLIANILKNPFDSDLRCGNCLLLDRRHQILYRGGKETITSLLKQPESLKLLSLLHGQNESNQYLDIVTKVMISVFAVTIAFGTLARIGAESPSFCSSRVLESLGFLGHCKPMQAHSSVESAPEKVKTQSYA